MKYKYMSQWSGEVQPSLVDAIRTIMSYILHYPFEWKMFHWRYNSKGW